jgi:hypothetical protein
MIEMRWLVPVEGPKVLQYRQKIDVTIRAGMWVNTNNLTTNLQWSEWRDVPLVAERDPGFP